MIKYKPPRMHVVITMKISARKPDPGNCEDDQERAVSIGTLAICTVVMLHHAEVRMTTSA
jgi:hypothetical protein